MTVLVTGSTGNVGRHVVAQLAQAGVRVRALTRTPEEAKLPESVEIVQGDLECPETLPAAFKNVERLYLFPVPATATESVNKPTKVWKTFEQVTGRPGRTFAQWAAEHAHDFR